MSEDFFGGNVADYDQHHAEAIDLLRSAETFLLAVPLISEEEGEYRIAMTGGGVNFDGFKIAVTAGLHAAAWNEIALWHHRDRWLRRMLIAACTANLIILAFNLPRLLS